MNEPLPYLAFKCVPAMLLHKEASDAWNCSDHESLLQSVGQVRFVRYVRMTESSVYFAMPILTNVVFSFSFPIPAFTKYVRIFLSTCTANLCRFRREEN